MLAKWNIQLKDNRVTYNFNKKTETQDSLKKILQAMTVRITQQSPKNCKVDQQPFYLNGLPKIQVIPLVLLFETIPQL